MVCNQRRTEAGASHFSGSVPTFFQTMMNNYTTTTSVSVKSSVDQRCKTTEALDRELEFFGNGGSSGERGHNAAANMMIRSGSKNR